MNQMNYIQACAHIRNGKLSVNNHPSPVVDAFGNFHDFSRSIYQSLSIDYTKFFKMDELCKLAFLAAELTLKEFSDNAEEKQNTAVILANASSTLSTDLKHQETISNPQNFFPNPAIFVYTLPNITIGEINIRHGFKGENTFFIFERYDCSFMSGYVNGLLNNNRTSSVLTGWTEYTAGHYDAFICLVGKEKKGVAIEHNGNRLHELYNAIEKQ